MPQTLLLLEDNIDHSQHLKALIEEYNINSEISFDVISVTSFAEAIRKVDQNISIDAFLLDISLDNSPDNEGGLNFARHLQTITKYRKKPVLFLTAYGTHLPKALNELHCYAFLMKPYTKKELFQQLYDLSNEKKELYIKTSENIYVKCTLDTLLYIQANGRYLKYVTTDSCFYSRQYTLSKITGKLPDNFVRCHKSYTINKTFIGNCDFMNRYIELHGTAEKIPISRKIDPQTILDENFSGGM